MPSWLLLWLRRALRTFVFGSVVAGASATEVDLDQPIRIQSVQLREVGTTSKSDKVALPAHITRPHRQLVGVQASAEFEVKPQLLGHSWMVYSEKLQDGGRFKVNGIDIGGHPTTDADTTVRRMLPFVLRIPSGVLREGRNELTREWQVHENLLILPNMWVGTEAQIEPVYQERLAGYSALPRVTGVFAAVLALVIFSIYWKNRELNHYLWVSVSAVGFCFVNSAFWVTSVPSWFYGYWQFLFFCGSSALTLGSYFYVLFASGIESSRYRRYALVVSVLHNVGYLLQFWWSGLTHFPDYSRFGALLTAVFTIFPLYGLVVGVWRNKRVEPWVLLILILVGVSINVLEAASLNGSSKILASSHLLQPFVLVWFFVVCVLLIRDFSAALRTERSLAFSMKEELAVQKQELSRLHALERASQEAKAAALERGRIMQDMHDGLGSQLVSSLAMARAGELSSLQTYDLLRSCIDDLRLAIDTAQDTEDSLLLALGNLRFRMQPRLKAAGITLQWKTQTLSNPLPLRPQHQLPVLRVIQESLTNALKHANASTITVEATNTDTELTIRIEDDGQGFDVDAAKEQATGKGLSGLEKRARVLGAQLQVRSTAQGTRVELMLPWAEATKEAP